MSKKKISKKKNEYLSDVMRRDKHYTLIPNALVILLSGVQLKVFSYLALIPDKDNPPQTEIAPILGLSPNTVRKALRDLIKLGLLSRKTINRRNHIYLIKTLDDWNLDDRTRSHIEKGIKQVECNKKLLFSTEKLASLDDLISRHICDEYCITNDEVYRNYSPLKYSNNVELERKKNKITPKRSISRDNTNPYNNSENSDLDIPLRGSIKEKSTNAISKRIPNNDEERDRISREIMSLRKIRLAELEESGVNLDEAETIVDKEFPLKSWMFAS